MTILAHRATSREVLTMTAAMAGAVLAAPGPDGEGRPDEGGPQPPAGPPTPPPAPPAAHHTALGLWLTARRCVSEGSATTTRVCSPAVARFALASELLLLDGPGAARALRAALCEVALGYIGAVEPKARAALRGALAAATWLGAADGEEADCEADCETVVARAGLEPNEAGLVFVHAVADLLHETNANVTMHAGDFADSVAAIAARAGEDGERVVDALLVALIEAVGRRAVARSEVRL